LLYSSVEAVVITFEAKVAEAALPLNAPPEKLNVAAGI